MRWFVEVASSSQPEAPEKWVVEAAQWQPALQAARSLRGEAAEMTGFSVELLEDGFRAVDPATFIRYIVRRAPDSTPISNPGSKRPQAREQREQNGGSSNPPSPGPSADRPKVTKASRIAAMLDLGAGRSHSTKPEAESKSPEAAAKRETAEPARSLSEPPVSSGAVAALSRPSGSSEAAASQPPPAPTAPVGDAIEPLPPAELLLQREEDPSATSPLTYRETVWVVPMGTSSDAAVRLLLGMFEGVRAALAGAKPGKLVNMAIFDHRFQGKPEAPPLATLTWKDWRDQGQGPDIRRLGDPPVSQRPSFPPPSQSAEPSVPVTATSEPAAPPTAPVPPPAPAVAVPVPTARAAPTELVAPAAPAVVPGPVPPADMVPAPPPDATALASGAIAPAPSAIAPGPPRMTAPSVPRVRLSGVELITDLFEAMHTLHFLRDSLEGAEFILALVMEKLPSAVGLVHFYDINSREFVVVRAVGPGAAKALRIRTSEKDPLIAEAMGGRRAVVIDDAKMDPRAQNGRWALIGSCLSLVCAPVEQGGRFLGLLELSNPRDGGPFDESDGHALTYMGEQFAEFLATRGVVLDPDRIGGR